MAARLVAFDDDARRGVERGMNQLADAVKVTLGPKGPGVALNRRGAPAVTSDGVSAASEVGDRWERIGAELVREVARKTGDAVGDGTTTAVVLAQALVGEGLRDVAAGASPVSLKLGIDAAVELACAELARMAVAVGEPLPPGDLPEPSRHWRRRAAPPKARSSPNPDVAAVAAIYAGRDAEMGEMIAHAIGTVGREGAITVEESDAFGLELEFTEGMAFEKGYISHDFVTDPECMDAVLEDPCILIVNSKVSADKDLQPLLGKVAQSGRPLVIIAGDVQGEALAALVVSKDRGLLKSVAVKAPGIGDRRTAILQDIAILTGGQVISEGAGLKLELAGISALGQARRVVVTRDQTTIADGAGDADAIAGRINQIRADIENTSSVDDREELQERLAMLAGGLAVIRVGAATELERKECKHRIKAAIRNVRAAVEEGIVPGGGVALLQASAEPFKKLSLSGDEATGAAIVRRALEEPLKQIAVNAGHDGDVVAERVKTLHPGHGLNATTGEYVDMFTAGIIDPVRVTRSALQNAASIAVLFLTTGAVIPGKAGE